jgi:small GTP-binding protein
MSEFLNHKIPAKIVLLGLDNSGKSSIVLSLKEKSNIMSFLSLKPTKGYNIEKFESGNDYNFNIWDLGGQKEYRMSYLQNFNFYMEGVSRVIFVIDVQDIERYDLALKYFEDIINLLNKQEMKVPLSIYLHKFDPGLTEQEKFSNIEDILKLKIIDKLKKSIPPDWDFDIFKTCIYTIFEKVSY